MSNEQQTAREQELADQGLGEFAAYLADLEATAGRESGGPRSAREAEPVRPSRDAAASAPCEIPGFEAAWARNEDALEAEMAEETAAQDARRVARSERPQRRAERFDLGAFYEDVGLAREDAEAVKRVMTGVGGDPAEAGEDVARLLDLLRAVDADLEAEVLRVDLPSPHQREDREIEFAAAQLAEALDALAADGAPPARAFAAESGGRIALLLDAPTSAALLRAAEASGFPAADHAAFLLRRALSAGAAPADRGEQAA